jgi:hypothetical protein
VAARTAPERFFQVLIARSWIKIFERFNDGGPIECQEVGDVRKVGDRLDRSEHLSNLILAQSVDVVNDHRNALSAFAEYGSDLLLELGNILVAGPRRPRGHFANRGVRYGGLRDSFG